MPCVRKGFEGMKVYLKNIDFTPYKRDNYIILLSAPLLLSLYYYNGRSSEFLHYFPNFIGNDHADLYSMYWQFCCFFILMGLLPVLYLIGKMHASFKDFGLGAGEWKKGLRYVLFLMPVIILIIWFAAKLPGIQAEYPMLRSLLYNRAGFWPYEIAYVLFYYVSWEFYFRGFLLFGLARELGKSNALLIQIALSCLIHLGKPEAETLGAIIAGLIFGIIAFKSRSIWYGIILHATIGVLTDYFSLLHIAKGY